MSEIVRRLIVDERMRRPDPAEYKRARLTERERAELWQVAQQGVDKVNDTRTTLNDRELGRHGEIERTTDGGPDEYLTDAELYGVDEKYACPSCGEDDVDMLVWDEDGETVRCASCGTVYVP